MATRTLYDWQPTTVNSSEELVHARPSVMVHLLDHDPARHQQACDKVREEAWRTAVHMLDVVLARATAQTEAVAAVTRPPFDKSFALLMPLISFLSSSSCASKRTTSSSSVLHFPPVYIQNSGYSADATCRSVRTLVELGSASEIFDKLQECLKRYVEHVIQLLAFASDSIGVSAGGSSSSSSNNDSNFNREFITFLHLAHAWGHYRLTVLELQGVWVFLDRWHIHRVRAVRSIEGLAIELLKEALLQHPWLLQRAQVGYLECLRQDFLQTSETRREMCLFTDLCLCIQVYFLRLEPEIINVASQFYTSIVNHMWEEEPIPAAVFFPQVERYLVEGRERVHAGCIATASLPRLEEAAQTSLLMQHGVGFLERDFAQLVQESNYTCFRLAWQLLAMGKYVRLGKQCGAVFRQYMLREGAVIMRQLTTTTTTTTTTTRRVDGEEYGAVKEMIALMCRGDRVIEKGFAEDAAFFSVQLRDALAEVLQENQTEFAEQLARYLDWTIREADSATAAAAAVVVGSATGNEEDDGSHGISSASPAMNINSNTNSNSMLTSQVHTQTAVSSSSPAGGVSVADASDLDTRLKYIGRLYSLFPSKEIFETFYWVDLSRRLLHYQRAPHIEVEESFIQSLKETCGAETSKFEGMINDVKTSLALNERYQVWAAARIKGETEPWPPRMQVENEEEAAAAVNEKDKQQKPDKKRKRRKGEQEETQGQVQVQGEGEEIQEGRGDEESAVDLANALASVDVKLHILTDNHWPKQTPLEIQLPQPLRTLARGVQNFYRRCFSDRRLLWQHQLSSAVVKCAVGKVRRQLTGTLLQAAILLTLQELIDGERSELSYVTVGVLCEQLAMDMSLPDVVSSLLGLCYPKFRLVLRDSSSSCSPNENTSAVPPLSAEDRLRFNEDFSINNMRGRMPLFGLRQRGGDAGTTTADGLDKGLRRSADAVMADRSHVIEAAIVRFMKENRRVGHEELFTTIPTLVRFTVDVPVMKKVVERLIERGFLERSGGTSYTYLL
ncbi:Cullin [Trypanosoma melophagium]|uniref:Cullin n=1 Tax=Trypanosoma melophagium TaxID=715481 RepID=UPI00351A8FAA|nr:Cullin [Trypanosoma melophagium]